MRRIPYQFIYRFFTNVLRARYSRGPNKKLVKPMFAGFYVTMKCNFRCTYCDDGSGNMYPDIPEQRLDTARTIEVLEILRRAWTGERFDFDGKYFHLRGVRVLPRPVSQPHPEILWGAAAPKAVQRAAKLDLGFASVSGKREIMLYLDTLKQMGKDPSRYSVVSSRIIHIANSEEEAWREASPAMIYQAELYAKWLAAGYGTDPSKTFIRPDPERLKRTGLLGPVDFVRRRVEQILNETPLTEFIAVCQLPGMDPAKAYRSLELFGKEILPAIKDGTA